MNLTRISAQVVHLPLLGSLGLRDEEDFPVTAAHRCAPACLPALDEVGGVDCFAFAAEEAEHAFAAHGDDFAALVGRGWVLDSGHFEDCGREVHDCAEGSGDAGGVLGGGMRGGEFGEERHADAAFGREGFVQSARGGGCLGPARSVPDEAVAAAEVLERVVVVGLQVLHHLALDDWVGFVRGSFGSVVGHEADEGVVELARLLEVVDDFADVVVDALDHCGEDFHRFARFRFL